MPKEIDKFNVFFFFFGSFVSFDCFLQDEWNNLPTFIEMLNSFFILELENR